MNKNGMVRSILGGTMLLAMGAAYADNSIVFLGCGSSAMGNVSEQAALTAASASKATNAYKATNAGIIKDGANPNQTGQCWVVWDNGGANNRKIYCYVVVDSTVGVRAFCNSAKMSFPASLPAPDSGYANLPADVQTSLEGQVFNTGLTDITPADAKATTARMFQLGYSGSNGCKGLGSNPGSQSTVFPVDFNISARPFTLVSLGASPMIFFVNKTDTAVGGLGHSSVTNINRYQLAGFLDGSLRRTSDIILDAGLPDVPVISFQREPLSGTYVTTEWCIPRSVDSSQEVGVLSTGVGENPLNETIPAYDSNNPNQVYTRGGRVRAISSSPLVKWANATKNGLGYAFWSFNNFSAANAGNTKYLTVDGADPLRDAYTDGSYPASSLDVTFRNVRNGGYACWSLLRGVTIANPGPDLVAYFNTITATDAGGNFVPKNELRVFRSHRTTAHVFTASNGNNNVAESGADAGGAVFPINADKNYFADTGLELINLRLGQPKQKKVGVQL